MNQNEAYLRLLRPYDEPLPATVGGRLADIPAIWGRAKLFFGRVIDHIGSTAAFSKLCVVRSERRELMDRLKPVERIVRVALVTRAIAFLLMTPEGRKLRRDTPKLALPEKLPPPAPPPNPSQHYTTRRIPVSLGVWQPWRPEPPKPPEPPQKDRHDPQSWSPGFRVLGLKLPASGERAPPCIPAKAKAPRPSVWVAGYTEESPRGLSPPPSPEPKPKDPAALILARRIEALGRILEKPARAIRRLARFIASLPASALDGLADSLFPHPRWHHGHHELAALRGHLRCALNALNPYEEPG